MEEVLEELSKAVTTYNSDLAVQTAKKVIQMGIDPCEAIEKGLARGIRAVGDQYERGEAFIYHLAIAAEVMNAALKVLEPEIRRTKKTLAKVGKVVLGTVEGDIHTIGKDLVKVMLVTTGFEVFDLGKDVPTAKFIEKAREVQADIIAASALLSTTKFKQKEIIEALKSSGMRQKVKVMIGGAAVDEEWAKKIGADAYGKDAIQAVKLARKMMGIEK